LIFTRREGAHRQQVFKNNDLQRIDWHVKCQSKEHMKGKAARWFLYVPLLLVGLNLFASTLGYPVESQGNLLRALWAGFVVRFKVILLILSAAPETAQLVVLGSCLLIVSWLLHKTLPAPRHD